MDQTPPNGKASAWRPDLPHDLPASLVVFLVALPLSMGIALASGAPIMSGLIAAVVGGIVVGLLGGAPLLVSGPAAGLAVMVYGFVQEFGLKVTFAIIAAAGVLQATLGVLRVARVALAIAPAVIHGMLAGIGVLITLSQLHIVLGGSPQSSAWANVRELPAQIADLHGPSTFLGLLTIAILAAWLVVPTRLRRVPGPLVAVAGATIAGLIAQADVPRVQLGGSLFEAIQLPSVPEGNLGAFLGAVLALTLVASAESLLSAVATDKLHTGARARLNRELFAQGVANTISGMIGGMPITGVIVRSAANVAAGGRTRWSAVLHGVWILLFVTQLGFLVAKVPLSVLAGLLVFVGVKLVDPGHIRELVKRGEAPVYFATLLGVVGINLLAGIGIGLTLAVLRLLRNLSQVKVKVETRGDTRFVHVTGALTFVGVPHLMTALAQIPPSAPVEVDLQLDFLDHAGFEALSGWLHTHEKLGGRVKMESLERIWAGHNLGPVLPAVQPEDDPSVPLLTNRQPPTEASVEKGQ